MTPPEMDSRSASYQSIASISSSAVGVVNSGGSSDSGVGVKTIDDEDWGMYFVEVRGKFMLFYSIMPPQPSLSVTVSGSGSGSGLGSASPASASPSPALMPVPPSSPVLVEYVAPTGNRGNARGMRPPSPAGRDANAGAAKQASNKGFGKIFDAISKKASQYARRPSVVDLRGVAAKDARPTSIISPPRPATAMSMSSKGGGAGGGSSLHSPSQDQFGPDRRSMDSARSFSVLGGHSPQEIKSAPKSLVGCISLQSAKLSLPLDNISDSMSHHLISPQAHAMTLLTGPAENDKSSKMAYLDLVDELTWDPSESNEKTVSSMGSWMARVNPAVRRAEMEEWVKAIESSHVPSSRVLSSRSIGSTSTKSDMRSKDSDHLQIAAVTTRPSKSNSL
ncbi:hypothetical protein HDU76_010494, partial [Blyttiomyces sp. JEL0837]